MTDAEIRVRALELALKDKMAGMFVPAQVVEAAKVYAEFIKGPPSPRAGAVASDPGGIVEIPAGTRPPDYFRRFFQNGRNG